jgi:hypothetical protein
VLHSLARLLDEAAALDTPLTDADREMFGWIVDDLSTLRAVAAGETAEVRA